MWKEDKQEKRQLDFVFCMKAAVVYSADGSSLNDPSAD